MFDSCVARCDLHALVISLRSESESEEEVKKILLLILAGLTSCGALAALTSAGIFQASSDPGQRVAVAPQPCLISFHRQGMKSDIGHPMTTHQYSYCL